MAKNVQPDCVAAKNAVDEWKQAWCRATQAGPNGTGEPKVLPEKALVQEVLDKFGHDLLDLGRPVWNIQANALSTKDFTK